MDLPKILLTGLFVLVFFVFFGFPRVFGQLGLGQQKPREKPNKPKKPILNGLTQDSSHRIVFFVFFGFPRVFGQLGLGRQKPREKPNKPKKPILNGLTQDSSHRIVFFVFFGFRWVFGQLGLGQQQPREKPNKPKNNKKNPEWTCPRFFSQDWFFLFWYKSRNFSNEKKYSRITSKKTTHAKTQRSQRPFLIKNSTCDSDTVS